MAKYGPPEKVYVELEWYDGPRAGIADVNGQPHRFKSLFDESDDDYLGTFLVFPIDDDMLSLEVEQWHIFVEWNTLYESGAVGIESHPGHGGVNSRWDELEFLLENNRNEVPAEAKKAVAEFVSLNRENRYDRDGPDYALCWSVQ